MEREMQTTQQATKTVIRIGHPAYRGDNAMKYCFSKAAAVRELRVRGLKRDIARSIVNEVAAKFGGYATTRASEYGDVIEVGNYSHDYAQ